MGNTPVSVLIVHPITNKMFGKFADGGFSTAFDARVRNGSVRCVAGRRLFPQAPTLGPNTIWGDVATRSPSARPFPEESVVSPASLHARGVSRAHGATPVLDAVDLTVAPGDHI